MENVVIRYHCYFLDYQYKGKPLCFSSVFNFKKYNI